MKNEEIEKIKDWAKKGEISGVWWTYSIDEEDKRRWYIDYNFRDLIYEEGKEGFSPQTAISFGNIEQMLEHFEATAKERPPISEDEVHYY